MKSHLNQTLPSGRTTRQKSSKKDSNSLSLTQRGLNQAHRNDSSEIWKLLSIRDDETQANSCDQSDQSCIYQNNLSNSFKRSPRLKNDNYDFISDYQKDKPKLIQTQPFQKNQQKCNSQQKLHIKKAEKLKQKYINDLTVKSQSKQKLTPNIRQNKQPGQNRQDQKAKQQALSKQQFKQQMQVQIDNYLQNQKHQTRTLSNSAFAKLYNRPCQQNYGHKNTQKYSRYTNNLLKTHNITPHTMQNTPDTYQSYSNALRYAKRTKINEDDKKQRIQRQFLKFFDNQSNQKVQKSKSLNKKKSKSQQKTKPTNHRIEDQENVTGQKKTLNQKKTLKELLGKNQPNFVYRHVSQNGQVRLFKDTHGIKCYVDHNFTENEQALVSFQKRINPILPQKIRQEDMNIDIIRRQNHKKSIQQGFPGHYLIPCVETPYDKQKYSFRNKRAVSTHNK